MSAPEQSYDPYSRFRKSLLSPYQVKELSQLRPSRVVIDVALLWIQIVAAWWVVATWTEWWVVLLAIPFIGTRHYALHIIGHDGIHRRLFNSGYINDLFTDIFIFAPEGAITRINGQNHINHHRFLATDEDPDRHKYCSARKATRLELLLYVTGLSALGPLWRNVFLGEDLRRRATSQAREGYRARDVVLLLVLQSLLIGGLTLTIGWWAYPVLWMLPVYVHTFCGDLTRFFLEHSHPAPDDQIENQRMITYSSSPLERLFFSPKNINLHAAHHLWPSIPYYNLPRADAMIRDKGEAEGLIWRESYIRSLLDFARALPRPDWRT